MSSRDGFDIEQDQIRRLGGHLGGAWGPLDFGTYCPRLVEFLVAAFPVRNVLELGCGYGAALRHFRSLGCNVLGVEGLPYYAERANVPVIVHDMERGPLKLANVDLVYSVEFVEHVTNTAATLDTLANGKVVCFSCALPGQIGHHHVSCLPQEFWIEGMRARGYEWEEELSQRCRDFGGGYFGCGGMLFVRKSERLNLGLAQGEYRSADSAYRG